MHRLLLHSVLEPQFLVVHDLLDEIRREVLPARCGPCDALHAEDVSGKGALGVGHDLADGGGDGVRGEVRLVQADADACFAEPGAVAELVEVVPDGQDGDAVEERLVGAGAAAVGEEELRVRVREDGALGGKGGRAPVWVGAGEHVAHVQKGTVGEGVGLGEVEVGAGLNGDGPDDAVDVAGVQGLHEAGEELLELFGGESDVGAQ